MKTLATSSESLPPPALHLNFSYPSAARRGKRPCALAAPSVSIRPPRPSYVPFHRSPIRSLIFAHSDARRKYPDSEEGSTQPIDARDQALFEDF